MAGVPQVPIEIVKKLLSAPVQQGSTPTELYIEVKQGKNSWQLWVEYCFDESLVLTRWCKEYGYDYAVPDVLEGLREKLVIKR